MKSNKQRRAEIKAMRLQRAERQRESPQRDPRAPLPGALPVDTAKLLERCTSYIFLPVMYLDRPYVCRDCGVADVWTAKQQKWWYEEVGGNLNSQAVRCRPCRRLRRERFAARSDAALHLQTLCNVMRGMNPQHLSAADRRLLEESIVSKWDGVRVVAARVLCANNASKEASRARPNSKNSNDTSNRGR